MIFIHLDIDIVDMNTMLDVNKLTLWHLVMDTDVYLLTLRFVNIVKKPTKIFIYLLWSM